MTDVPFWADKMPTEEPNSPDVPEHLGGHYNYTNMDTETLDYLVQRFDVKSMLDVGCGTGGMVDYANSIGVAAHGVDGDPHMARAEVDTHDFTKGVYQLEEEVDLIWSVEFVEHVEEKYTQNFLDTFLSGKVLFMTHALPQQGGKHHVNLQWADYWIVKLQEQWDLDQEATNHIRTFSKVIPYVKHSAMVWVKK
jgi:SAM-dependent methyltransferase